MLVSPSCEVTLAAQANEGTWEERAYGWRRKVLDTCTLYNRQPRHGGLGRGLFPVFSETLNKTPWPVTLITEGVSEVVMLCSNRIMKSLAGLPRFGGKEFAFSIYSLSSNPTSMKY